MHSTFVGACSARPLFDFCRTLVNLYYKTIGVSTIKNEIFNCHSANSVSEASRSVVEESPALALSP